MGEHFPIVVISKVVVVEVNHYFSFIIQEAVVEPFMESLVKGGGILILGGYYYLVVFVDITGLSVFVLHPCPSGHEPEGLSGIGVSPACRLY